LISSSKSFSLAGQRIGTTAISDRLFVSDYPDLKRYFSSAQYGLTAILKAVNDGEYNYVEPVKESELVFL